MRKGNENMRKRGKTPMIASFVLSRMSGEERSLNGSRSRRKIFVLEEISGGINLTTKFTSCGVGRRTFSRVNTAITIGERLALSEPPQLISATKLLYQIDLWHYIPHVIRTNLREHFEKGGCNQGNGNP